MHYFSEDSLTNVQANEKAQQLAFAPIAFQAARLLCKTGILKFIQSKGPEGATLAEVQKKMKVPAYGVKVLLESGLGSGLLLYKNQRFVTTKTAYMLLFDPMTRVNMDFTHDVCYAGMFHLDKSIKKRKPAGLKKLGKWKTIYEGLSKLDPQVKKSWFDFDHYYSDLAFPKALPIVFEKRPKKILDVGGNTGKWAKLCTEYDSKVKVTIADLPGQLSMARPKGRIKGYEIDVLDSKQKFPKGYDVIWMSQFLDCFSPKEITSILKRARKAMTKGSSLYILETYWDRQANQTAAFCLQQTSLYFTCLANGNSQMYHSEDMQKCVEKAGLKIAEDRAIEGSYHTLFRCVI